MIITRDKIRPAIREVDTIAELQGLITMCLDTPKDDIDFIQECASEIHWRRKEKGKKLTAEWIIRFCPRCGLKMTFKGSKDDPRMFCSWKHADAIYDSNGDLLDLVVDDWEEVLDK